MVIFNNTILTYLVSSLHLIFSLHSLTTLISIYYVPNTHFFSLFSPSYPKRSIAMQSMEADASFLYQLLSQASKCNLRPTVTLLRIFLGKRWAGFTPEPSPGSCSDRHSHHAWSAFPSMLTAAPTSSSSLPSNYHWPEDTLTAFTGGLWPQRETYSSSQPNRYLEIKYQSCSLNILSHFNVLYF